MSLKIRILEGNSYPVIVCDHCGDTIKNAKHGNTVWREPLKHGRSEGQLYAVQHTHKKCNWDFMHRRFPEPDDASWCWMSHELQDDLFMLMVNTKYNARAAERKMAWTRRMTWE